MYIFFNIDFKGKYELFIPHQDIKFRSDNMKRDIGGYYYNSSIKTQDQKQPDFDEFEAVELYCDKCNKAVPVRKSLLLILPEGDKYEYRCSICGNTVGDKIDKTGQYYNILKR